MNIRRLTQAVALAIALGATGLPAFAQRVIVVPQGATVVTIETWANDTAVRYDGRIPRYVYLEEMGRRYDADGNRLETRERYLNDWRNRWDARDPSGRGLTPVEVSRLTRNVDSGTSGLPVSGTGVQPGNMGPANSKGQ
jgi:hypothetical protein